MSIARDALASTKGRIVLVVLGGIVAWQLWLSAAAGGKIADDVPRDARRVDVRVTLGFTPERFHVQALQDYGRVSGTRGDTVEVRGVNQGDLRALARPFWVRRVAPIEQGG